MGEPLVVFNPETEHTLRGSRSDVVVSSLDFVPTILDWLGLSYPNQAIAAGKPAKLTGTSILPLTEAGKEEEGLVRSAYASHNYHSLYAYYPMRAIVQGDYRLVHNIASDLSFGILEDVYGTSTWRKIMNDTSQQRETGWIYDYHAYKHRPEFELYHLIDDPLSLHNLAANKSHEGIFATLQAQLFHWREDTGDPWLPCQDGSKQGVCSV